MSGATLRQHVIDCDADPWVPIPDWSVDEHQRGGTFVWNKELQTNALYLSEDQRGIGMAGDKLQEELKAKDVPILNANVLDYLFMHRNIIPDEWKNKYVFFWGTIYRDGDGDSLVRFLFYHPTTNWAWSAYRLGYDGNEWNSTHPAAIRAA